MVKGLGLWCLTPLWTIYQLYRGQTNNLRYKNNKKVQMYTNDNKFVLEYSYILYDL
jgi:hypothetical protein